MTDSNKDLELLIDSMAKTPSESAMNIGPVVDMLTNTRMPESSVKEHIQQRRDLLYNENYQSYSKSIPRIVIAYLTVVGMVVILNGFGGASWLSFHLSNSIMISLLCTTTANVLGLMYIVANHLFPKNLKVN